MKYRRTLVCRYPKTDTQRWRRRRVLLFYGLGGGEEVGVGEICEPVGEEFAHVGDDPSRTTADIVGDDAASDGA